MPCMAKAVPEKRPSLIFWREFFCRTRAAFAWMARSYPYFPKTKEISCGHDPLAMFSNHFIFFRGVRPWKSVLLAMSFAGNVEREWAEEMITRVGLKERMHHKPGELSVGQQQRVALARSLVNRPNLLLADEPTGNLDPKNAAEVLDIMRNLCLENHASLLLVSHDEKIVAGFERQIDWSELNGANPLRETE